MDNRLLKTNSDVTMYSVCSVEFVELLLIEKHLENSLIRKDIKSFSICLERIIAHPYCQNLVGLKNWLSEILETLKANYITWFQFQETMEQLRTHIFQYAKSVTLY